MMVDNHRGEGVGLHEHRTLSMTQHNISNSYVRHREVMGHASPEKLALLSL